MCENAFARPMSIEEWHERQRHAACQDARRGTWSWERCHCQHEEPFCCYCAAFDRERVLMFREEQYPSFFARLLRIFRFDRIFAR